MKSLGISVLYKGAMESVGGRTKDNENGWVQMLVWWDVRALAMMAGREVSGVTHGMISSITWDKRACTR